MFVAGYGHFLRTAASLQWDEAAVDLTADVRAWPALDRVLRARLVHLIAGFCVAEAAVADHIVPFEAAAHDPDAAACFGAQAVDERRHARFFDRVAAEVLRTPDAGPAQRRRELRALLAPEFLELFEERLPQAARGLAEEPAVAGRAGRLAPEARRGHAELPAAVAVYHLLLEGIVFSVGQSALLRLLEDARPPLPGLRRGVELVARDERWHIGLGARLLDDLDVDRLAARPLLAEGEAVAAVWGDAVDARLVARAVALHERRLRATASEDAERPAVARCAPGGP